MSDRRYLTARWQRARRVVLNRASGVCQVRGPRCIGVATTADHIIPVSQGGSFWAWENLRASCRKCNFGAGAAIAARNRHAAAERIAELEQANWHLSQTVEALEERCEQLSLALAAAMSNPAGKPARKRAQPAIH